MTQWRTHDHLSPDSEGNRSALDYLVDNSYKKKVLPKEAFWADYPHDPPEDNWEPDDYWSDDDFASVLAPYEQQGLSCLYDDRPDALVISHVEVDPSLRNKGLGSQFMEAANEYALENGKQLIVDRVDNHDFFNKFPFLQQTDDKEFSSNNVANPSAIPSVEPVLAKKIDYCSDCMKPFNECTCHTQWFDDPASYPFRDLDPEYGGGPA